MTEIKYVYEDENRVPSLKTPCPFKSPYTYVKSTYCTNYCDYFIDVDTKKQIVKCRNVSEQPITLHGDLLYFHKTSKASSKFINLNLISIITCKGHDILFYVGEQEVMRLPENTPEKAEKIFRERIAPMLTQWQNSKYPAVIKILNNSEV